MIICLDNGHGEETKGKRSPDGTLREYKYAREIVTEVANRLTTKGYDTRIITPETTDISLKERCRRINAICKEVGSKNVLSVSVHNNAAGDGTAWKSARGFVVCIAPNASANSKKLAQAFYAEAENHGLQGNRCVPADKYWVQNLAMCRDTNCPAVLTENLFQDNKEDVEYLLSDKGRDAIARMHVDAIINYIINQVSK